MTRLKDFLWMLTHLYDPSYTGGDRSLEGAGWTSVDSDRKRSRSSDRGSGEVSREAGF